MAGRSTSTDLAAAVVASLARSGRTLATAESLTGGGVGAALTAVPGASAVYLGGIIAYATDLKHRLLGVDADDLARNGAVAAPTAVAMAVGARLRTRADIGIATTGVAGPAAQEGHGAGTVFIAVADRAGEVVHELRLAGDRATIRTATIDAVLALVLDRVDEPGPGAPAVGGPSGGGLSAAARGPVGVGPVGVGPAAARGPSGDDDGSCGC